MTVLALSLFILACGWKFIKDWRFTRYAALKNAGHPQYFGAAIAAAYVGCLSASLHSVFQNLDAYSGALSSALSYLPQSPKDKKEELVIAWLAAIAGWSFFVSCALSALFNSFLFRDPMLLVAIARKVGAIDELEALCLQCLETGMLLAVTLKSGKVYVGVPEGYSSIDGEKKWIAIWPMASGYRDEKHKLEITTYYSPQYELVGNGSDSAPGLDDFRVVLPRGEISTAQSFDIATYSSFGVGELSTEITGDDDVPSALAVPDAESDGGAVEEMINAVNQNQGEVADVDFDNATELTAEIIPAKDATLLSHYFWFVVSVSLSIVLVSGTWLAAIPLLMTGFFLMRLLFSRERWPKFAL